MTIKSSISLRDNQHVFAKPLVVSGRFPSLIAVVEQGLDVLRQQDADAQADRDALRLLLRERAQAPFVSAYELRARLAANQP